MCCESLHKVRLGLQMGAYIQGNWYCIVFLCGQSLWTPIFLDYLRFVFLFNSTPFIIHNDIVYNQSSLLVYPMVLQSGNWYCIFWLTNGCPNIMSHVVHVYFTSELNLIYFLLIDWFLIFDLKLTLFSNFKDAFMPVREKI